MSIGIPDALFWSSTPRETEALIERHGAMERERTLRATFIAAAIYNVHRKPGTRPIQAADLVRTTRRGADEGQERMTVEETRTFLNRWARGINARYEKPQEKAETPPQEATA